MSTLVIRKMTVADSHACQVIDASAVPGDSAWSWDEFSAFLRVDGQGGLVAVWNGRIVGFLTYRADRTNRRLQLVRIGTAAGWQRRRVGSGMVSQIRQWLKSMPDVVVWTLIHERHLPMQCFLRANGFRAICICKGHCDEGESDAFLFELRAA
jgi:GNAT superfamily N-acetyltransferase